MIVPRPTVFVAVIIAWLSLATPGAGQQIHVNSVLEWNAITVSVVGALNPFAQARAAAMTHLAMFEALNTIDAQYEPYLGPLTGPADASPDAAAIAAAHGVLRALVPAAAATLDLHRSASLAVLPEGPGKASGVALGEAAAAAMLAHRAQDGSTPPQFHVPSSTTAGEWQPTPACPPAGGVLRHWGNVTPFGIKDAAQFRSSPPPPLTSQRYARDFEEVKTVGDINSSARTSHQTDLARFYNGVLAVATWNTVVGKLAALRRASLVADARLLALLNMAISDALVSVMDTKYDYVFWRPETAIHRADDDGNPRTQADGSFQPLIIAPCFPSYGSAHAAGSYAARQIAETFFGDEFTEITLTHPSMPGFAFHYGSFEEITNDIDTARIYGGIHFRFDQRAGARQGKQVGRWVHAHHLRSRREPVLTGSVGLHQR